jgi:hypothetical protein
MLPCLILLLIGQPLGIYNAIEGIDDSPERQPSNEIVIPPGLQTINGLSEEQIKQIMHSMQLQDYRNNPKNVDGESVSIFSYCKMLGFIGLLSSLVLILNRDYNNIVTVWFVRTFPRESSTFGLCLKNEL